MNPTRERIFQACEVLSQNVQAITPTKLRDYCGGVGSYTTYHKYLHEWKNKRIEYICPCCEENSVRSSKALFVKCPDCHVVMKPKTLQPLQERMKEINKSVQESMVELDQMAKLLKCF